MTDYNLPPDLKQRLQQAAQKRQLSPDALLAHLLDRHERPSIWERAFKHSKTSALLADATQPDLPIVAVNDAFEKTTGYTADEVLGRNCRFLQGDDRDQEARRIIRHALQNQEPCTVRLRNYRKDGTLFWNELHLAPIRNAAGEVTHFLANQIDVTEEVNYQRELAHRERQYRQMVETANEGVWGIDFEGNTLFANQRMADILGRRMEDLQNINIWRLFREEDKQRAQKYFDSRRQGESQSHDFRFVHKDGHDAWVLINASPLFDENEEPFGAVGYITDITRRVEAERKLAQREERYKLLTELMTDHAFSFQVDKERRVTVEWIIGSGIDLEQTDQLQSGTAVTADPIHPDDRQRVQEAITYLQDHNENVTVEYRVKSLFEEDVAYTWIQADYEPVWSEEEQRVVRFYGASHNITGRKEAELRLKESENRFRTISEMTSDYAFGLRVLADGTVKRDWITAESVKRITGYTADELAANGGWEGLTHPDDIAHLQKQLAELLRTETQLLTQYRIVTKDGRIRHVESRNRSIADESGRVVRIIGSTTDITARVQAQRELAESEARFRTMANSAPVLIWVSDTRKRCTYFNQTWLAFTGRPLEKELGFGWADGVHPDDYERCLNIYETAFEEHRVFSMEYRLRRHDGVYRWVRDDAIPRYLPDGTFAGYIGSCVDITEIRDAQQELKRLVAARTAELEAAVGKQEQAERELRRERDLLQNMMRTSPAAIFLVGTDSRIKMASDRAVMLVSRAGDDIVGELIYGSRWKPLLLDGSPVTSEDSIITTLMKENRPVYGVERSIRNGQGRRILVSLNAAPLRDEEGKITEIVLAASDITMRKKWEQTMENALAHERQLNEIRGRFISTITHEVKTPLSIINVSGDILKRMAGRLTVAQVNQRVDYIKEQVNRLNRMVDDIIEMNQMESSSYQPQPTEFDLHQLLYQIAEDAQFANQDQVRVVLDLAQSPALVTFDRTLIRQVLSNLVGNAVKYSLPGTAVHVVCLDMDDGLQIKIADQGIGIPEKDMDYLFDDFFRAGNAGEIHGRGLGLAIVKRAVDLQKGQIAVESVEGQGTSFTVTLPYGLAKNAASSLSHSNA